MGRGSDFVELIADEDAEYDEVIEINLSDLEPLVAQPHMPDQVCKVSELAGKKIDQCAIGSCTNSSYSDLKNTAQILSGKKTPPETDLLISPGSKQVMKMLARENLIEPLLDAGARVLECTCGPASAWAAPRSRQASRSAPSTATSKPLRHAGWTDISCIRPDCRPPRA